MKTDSKTNDSYEQYFFSESKIYYVTGMCQFWTTYTYEPVLFSKSKTLQHEQCRPISKWMTHVLVNQKPNAGPMYEWIHLWNKRITAWTM